MPAPIQWADLEHHGRRLEKTIRRLDKKMRHTNNTDQQIRLAQTIGQLSEKCVNIAKLHTSIEDILKTHKNESLKH